MSKSSLRRPRQFIFIVILFAALLALHPGGVQQGVGAAENVTLTVTGTADAEAVDGICSLREAILAANTNASVNECAHDGSTGTDTIAFAIGAPGSLQTITLSANLPTISDPVVLDGWSQGGAGYTGPPLIELNGENLNAGGDRGFRVDSGGTTVRGFVINRFDAVSGAGIWLRIGDANWIYANYIGTDAAGTTPLPNYYGIWIDNWGNTQPSDDNIIGTNGDGVNDSMEGNLISANNNEEIRVETNGNWIAGNFIGTNASGSAALGSNAFAVPLYGDNNIIGTNGDGVSDGLEGNLISGNDYGIGINNSSGHTIAGNIIGLDASGSLVLGNTSNGIDCNASANPSERIVIGTNSDGISDDLEGNIISGNGSRGYSTFYNNCRHITISGNKIGTDITGMVALGNGSEGIIISAGDWYTITNNMISANGVNGSGAGIYAGSAANNIIIQDNIIGSDANGTGDLGNTGYGIRNSFSNNQIISNNQISANGSSGILSQGSSDVAILDNLIGVQADGSTNLGNGEHGVYVTDSTLHTIANNTIAYSDRSGVIVDSGAISNTITANAIYANIELGIDLDFEGVTPTDPDDADTGPNGLQNHPAVLSAVNTADQITIGGTLDSTPNTAFTLEFFSNPVCDPSGNGEGQIYLGSDQVNTDPNGDASYSITLSASVPQGRYLTATATGPEGTSEFSVCYGPTGPVQDSPISGLSAANDGPQLDHNPVRLSAAITTGSNVSYQWDPGDGTGVQTGQIVTHTYTSPGSYTAVVTATNAINQQTASTTVTVNPSASIVGHVWNDWDGDGERGPGEIGFSGKTVRVEQNGRTYTDTTNANGAFILRGLDAGSYTIFGPGAISGYRIFGTNIRVRSITLAGVGYPQNFTYRADFTGVQGRAWLDDDFDGRYDSGESLLTNHSVSLIDDVSGAVSSTTTDSNGYFRIDLSANDGDRHTLLGERPNLYEDTRPTVTYANQHGYTTNLGYQPGAVGGCVASPGSSAAITGLTLTLRDSGGSQIAATSTGGDGCYIFASADAQGAFSVHLSPAAGDLIAGPDTRPAVYLGTPLRVDWEVAAPAEAWVGLSAVDGISVQGGQSTLSGYQIDLATSGGVLTQTTNANGMAHFVNVPPGQITATVPLSGGNIGVSPAHWSYALPPGGSIIGGGFRLGTHGITAECRTPAVPAQEPNGRFFPCSVELKDLNGALVVNQSLAEGEQFFYQPAAGGIYRLSLTPDLPSGAELSAADIFYLPAGGSHHFHYPDFLPEQLGPVTGVVWTDANANGTRETTPYENAEGPAIGFTLELVGPDGSVIETTTSDNFGRYNLFPPGAGTYAVRIALPSSVLATTPNEVPVNRDLSELTGGVADFGIIVAADGIAGRVRFDDIWRSYASGVSVQLFDPADTSTPLASDTTGPMGDFSFGPLLPDDYLLRVHPPNGGAPVERLVTVSLEGAPHQEVHLAAQGSKPTIFVYLDANGNHVADSGEGLPNVSIAFDIGACGNVIDVNQTDADGFAASDLVFPNGGCARLTGELPPGLSPARPEGITLPPYHGGIIPLRMVEEATLLLRPFWDRNGNAVQDPGEPMRLGDVSTTIPGGLTLTFAQSELYFAGPTGSYQIFASGRNSAVIMRPQPMNAIISSLTQNSLEIPLAYENTLSGVLTGPNSGAVSGRTIEARDEDGNLIAAATTGTPAVNQPGGRSYTPPAAASGGPASAPFSFHNLPPGMYRLRIIDPPAGMVPFDVVDVYHDPSAPANAELRLISVDHVSGVVYWDDNYNADRDGGEAGTNYYDVMLLNDAGMPEQVVTPAADGTFVFTGLQAGVQYALTVPELYNAAGGISGSWITESPGWFTMGSWPSVADVGIANYGSDNPNSLAIGQVYLQNGAAREPVPGAAVGYYQLQSTSGLCNAASPSILGQTTSGADGRYRLPLTYIPGGAVQYCLVVLEAPGLVQNDLTVIADAAVQYTLPGGQVIFDQALNLEKDIKMRTAAGGQQNLAQASATSGALIHWNAFRDDNLNGMWDEDEFPLPGAILASGVYTAAGGMDGSGVLNGLTDGEHILEITSPTGYQPVGPETIPVFLAGEDVVLPPIGFAPAGSVSGVVFADKDGDGWLGSGGEYGLGDVAVTLSGPVVTTTHTAPNGRFSLPDLPDGLYAISVEAPLGMIAGGLQPVSVANGFGIVRVPLGSTEHITGMLYQDWDGDGLRLRDESLEMGTPITVTIPGTGSTLPSGGSVLFWNIAPGSYSIEPLWNAAAPVQISLGPAENGGALLPVVSPEVVRGTLWLDSNRDGIRQPWEPPLSGITVTLDGVLATQTGPSGRFIFAGVQDGSHSVEAALPTSLVAAVTPVSTGQGRGAVIGIAAQTPDNGTIYLPVVIK